MYVILLPLLVPDVAAGVGNKLNNGFLVQPIKVTTINKKSIIKYNFFILFLILECFCTFLIVSHNNFQRSSFLNSSNRLEGSVHSFVNSITEYLKLRDANDALVRKNAELMSKQPNAFYFDSAYHVQVYDSLRHQQYEYITAKVVNSTINGRNNYITLNKGRLQGILPEMGLISTDGVVGIVKDVSEHFSTAMSLLHKDSKISGKLKKANHIGSIVWDTKDASTASFEDIPKNAPVHIGDTIVTSTFSSIFPEGILIGTVKSVDLKAGSSFYDIKVNLSTNFYSLNYVYVVVNKYANEERVLEDSVKKHDH